MTPTSRLEQEHVQILALLDVLEGLAGRVNERDERSLREAEECVHLLRTFADEAHHGKEERHLFPALNDVGLPSHHGPVACMLLEHDAGRSDLADMAIALVELDDGAAEAAVRFSRAASRYIGLLRDHIGKENQVLFPLACKLVPADRVKWLERDYAAVDVEVFGEDGYAKTLERIAQLVASSPRGARPAVDDEAAVGSPPSR